MAMELEHALQDRLQRAIVTVPRGIFENYPQFLGKSEKILFIEGAENNIPDKEAVEGAEKIKELVGSLGADDLLIVLISGKVLSLFYFFFNRCINGSMLWYIYYFSKLEQFTIPH